MKYLESVFFGNGFMPHGHCYLWTPGLVWLHVISDALIVLAYFSIPIVLVYFVRNRKDLSFSWMFVCFAIFILACGTTHLMEIWNVWHSHYWISGGIKTLTALASLPTAILLARLVPAALALPSPVMLSRANVALEAEIQNRRIAEKALSELNVGLEARVAERLADLKAVNKDLLRQMAERKQVEEALRASEERFRSYFELRLIGTAISSPTKGWVEVNDEICRMLGYERSELLRKTWADVTHPDDLAADVADFNRVLAGEIDGYSIEKRFIRKDGKVIDTTLSGKCLRRADGTVDYFVVLLQDITERKQAEEALSEQALRYKTLMETSTDSIYVLNEKGDLQEANAAFLRRRGYTATEVRGFNVADWDAQWTHEQLQKKLRKLVGRSAVFETRHRCKDGSVFDVEVCATSVRIGGEQLFFVVTRDISERKRAEQALQETEQRFRELAENINEVFWLSDDQNTRTHYISPAYERVWGRSCASRYAAPSSWMDAVHPEDKEQLLAALAKRSLNEGYRNTYRIVRPDGSIRWIHDRGFPVRNEGGVAVRFAGIAEDITSQHQTAEALRESEQQMRLFMEATADCLWKWDLITGRVVRSVGFLRVFGYAKEEVDSSITWWEERLHPEDRAKVISTFQETIASGGNACSYEYQFRCKDGTLAVIQDRAYIVRDARGKPLCALGAMTDITERMQVEDRLRRSEEKFKALFGIAPVGISVLDRQHNVVDANPALERIMRLSREELLAGAYRRRSYLNADGTAKPLDEMPSERAVTQSQPINDVEVGIVTESGEIIWSQVSVAPLPLPDTSAVVITQDITERKLAEQALRESEERFRDLAENINEVFWVWTATPGNARCLYVSPAYATIWGSSCESLYSSPQSWKQAIHPSDKDRVLAEIENLDFEKMNDLTYRIVRPDQSIRWIRDRVFPVRDVTGVVVRFAGIAQDITESKEAEEAVRKANRQLRTLSRRRIQEQEDERRRLSRELHDQIGQSLTAAKINVEALRVTENPALVGRIDETSAILDQLLGQVRQISLDLRPPMLDDLGLVPALRSFIDEQGRRASIAVRFSSEHVPEKLDAEIAITCFRIAQEAITNAVRHAKASQLEIALRGARGKTLRLLARDNGIGFDAQLRQAQAVDLGLIGIRERAALVGGRVKIISSPRKGTTIDVSLPLTFRGERQARQM